MTEKSVWLKAVRGSKTGFDRLWGYADKLGTPVNKLSNKIGSEAFWPTSIDKESYKAARILQSFCKDGVYEDEIVEPAGGPKQKQRVLKKIPADVIKNAKGLAIFTTMRTGLWFAGAGGSGVLVGRMADGAWSPPSGILLHTAAIGFLVGVDIYDCVLVLNTQAAVNAFAKWRFTLGGEISAVAGPVGIGGILDTELHARQAPIFTYLRSRGFYAGVQIDGTVVIERADENEKYYGHKYSAVEIISGKVLHPSPDLKMLSETLRAAQGDTNIDESVLPTEAPPADFEVVKSDHVFGIPDRQDPDPFGVLALEKEGFQIKEAGSQAAASSDEFAFRPNPTSPIFDTYNRPSLDANSKRDSWRNSSVTVNSIDRTYVTMDMSTQTDFPEPTTPTTLSPSTADISNPLGISILALGSTVSEPKNADRATQLGTGTQRLTLPGRCKTPLPETTSDALKSATSDDEGSLDEDDDEEEVVIIQEVHQTARPQMVVRPRVVTVPARARPDLPIRNPSRMSSVISRDDEVVAGEPISPTSRASSSDKDISRSQDGRAREDSVTSTTPSQKDSATLLVSNDIAATLLPLHQTGNMLTSNLTLSDEIPLRKTLPAAIAQISQASGGAVEHNSPTPAGPVTKPSSVLQSWRPPSQRYSSPRTSLETVRYDNRADVDQSPYRPFNQRLNSPRSSIENAPRDGNVEVEQGQWRPSGERFSIPPASPRTTLEVGSQGLIEQKDTELSILGFSLPRMSINSPPFAEIPVIERDTSPMSGPRISLASMKMRLHDDDDDDDDDDNDDHYKR